MKYLLLGFVYWPIWWLGAYFGHSYIGMVVGAAIPLIGWAILWHAEFGTWKFWR